MAETTLVGRGWVRLPVVIRAIVSGLLIGMIAANIWPIFLLKLGMPIAAAAELLFLGAYVWWAAGGGPPRSLQAARAEYFRKSPLAGRAMAMGHGRSDQLRRNCPRRPGPGVSLRALPAAAEKAARRLAFFAGSAVFRLGLCAALAVAPGLNS